MNKSIIRNLLKIIIAGAIYYSGIFAVLNKLIKRKGLVIFSYHNFNTFKNSYWRKGSIYEIGFIENFKRQLIYIKKKIGFTKNIYIEKSDFNSPLQALITFDDGYLDNYLYAYPILKELNVPAVFFIPTKCISTEKPLWHDKIYLLAEKGIKSKKNVNQILNKINKGTLKPSDVLEIRKSGIQLDERLRMNWVEIKEMTDNGFIIGAHGRNHEPFFALEKEGEELEILGSTKEISKNISHREIYFAPPNGSYTKNTDELLKKAGVSYGFSINNGINNKNVNNFRLKRIILNVSDPICIVAMKILFAKIVH